jgi:hypothetical protein
VKVRATPFTVSVRAVVPGVAATPQPEEGCGAPEVLLLLELLDEEELPLDEEVEPLLLEEAPLDDEELAAPPVPVVAEVEPPAPVSWVLPPQAARVVSASVVARVREARAMAAHPTDFGGGAMRVEGTACPQARLRSLTRAVRVRFARTPVPASSKHSSAR